jgi:hypothetical protein
MALYAVDPAPNPKQFPSARTAFPALNVVAQLAEALYKTNGASPNTALTSANT